MQSSPTCGEDDPHRLPLGFCCRANQTARQCVGWFRTFPFLKRSPLNCLTCLQCQTALKANARSKLLDIAGEIKSQHHGRRQPRRELFDGWGWDCDFVCAPQIRIACAQDFVFRILKTVSKISGWVVAGHYVERS